MKTHREDLGRYYKNAPIYAAEGIHEKSFDLVQKYVKEGSSILELGAGSGAFSLRLHDHKYQVDASELYLSEWYAPEVKTFELDLNIPFSNNNAISETKYDSVVALEVIEHLENPSQFLREVKKIVKPTGTFIFSTPNVVDLESRIRFIRNGDFFYFNPALVPDAGHISILPFWLIEEMLKEIGWQVLERRFIGVFPESKKSFKNTLVKSLIKSLLKSYGFRLPADAENRVSVSYVCKPSS
jgi:2-polyprenyl-3-methyl-5-hydroxy-6-metoxy-1,4-benzoquinol methylase